MAIDQRALVGRPSLRRALGGLSGDQQDRFSAFTADIDPVRFRSQYRDRAREFLDNERELAAQRAPGLRRQMEQERYRAQTDRNFGGGDVGAIDYDAEDQIAGARRRQSLLRSI